VIAADPVLVVDQQKGHRHLAGLALESIALGRIGIDVDLPVGERIRLHPALQPDAVRATLKGVDGDIVAFEETQVGCAHEPPNLASRGPYAHLGSGDTHSSGRLAP